MSGQSQILITGAAGWLGTGLLNALVSGIPECELLQQPPENAKIRVLISEPHRTVRIGNRFVSVGRRLNSYIEFRNVHPDYQEHREAYLSNYASRPSGRL